MLNWVLPEASLCRVAFVIFTKFIYLFILKFGFCSLFCEFVTVIMLLFIYKKKI